MAIPGPDDLIVVHIVDCVDWPFADYGTLKIATQVVIITAQAADIASSTSSQGSKVSFWNQPRKRATEAVAYARWSRLIPRQRHSIRTEAVLIVDGNIIPNAGLHIE